MSRKSSDTTPLAALISRAEYGKDALNFLMPHVRQVKEELTTDIIDFPRVIFVGLNLTHIAELALKLVSRVESARVTSSHDLWKIFNGLSERSKSSLRAIYLHARNEKGGSFSVLAGNFAATITSNTETVAYPELSGRDATLDLMLKDTRDQNLFYRYFHERIGNMPNREWVIFHYEGIYFFCLFLLEAVLEILRKHPLAHSSGLDFHLKKFL